LNQIALAVMEGVSAFFATNIDDLVILLLFFAQVKDKKIKAIHVVSGSSWGLVVLILLSLVGFFGGLVISSAWIGLLGILPITIGIKQLMQPEEEQEEIQTVSNEITNPGKDNRFLTVLTQLLHPQTYKVAAVTFANGGDNIGVYVPLFAASNIITLSVILVIFFILKGVWCYLAYLLTKNPKIAYGLTKYGNTIVPYVLIALGFFIFAKNGTFTELLKN
jgi:cadmium resistance transport/sequestration family protein